LSVAAVVTTSVAVYSFGSRVSNAVGEAVESLALVALEVFVEFVFDVLTFVAFVFVAPGWQAATVNASVSAAVKIFAVCG
jgi:hypothetical protein